jgi:hypothetical protein
MPPPSTTATARVTVTSGLYRRVSWSGYRPFQWSREYPEETSCLAGRETMRMTAEELTANRHAAGPVVRLAIACRIAPVAMAAISVGFAVIAAVWLSLGTARADGVALVAAIAVFAAGHTGRVLAGPVPGRPAPAGRAAAPAVEWGLTACGVLAEVVIYAGIAASVSLHPASASRAGPAGNALGSTFVARLGGTGTTGVWQLATIAVIIAVLLPVVDVSLHGLAGEGSRLRAFGQPGDVRLPLAGAVVLLAGARAALVVLLVLGVAALGATIIDGTMPGRQRGEVRAYRGDGWLSVWIGGFVRGRLPPIPPLFVGLLVTGMLVALGLRNLPGALILTPVEAMLLAALGSWHPHDGRRDWLVPPLLQAAEYVFLAEVGFADGLWPPLTFALVAAAGFRHLDLAYRVRGGLASGVDRRGLGWEGRMIVAGIAAAAGIQAVVYPALTVYLWWLNARDWAIGWSGGHAAIDR